MVKADEGYEVDFSEAGDFDIVPPGLYVVKITAAERKISSNDNPMIKWEFTITEGDFSGRKVWTNTMLMPTSLWVLKKMLRALNVGSSKLSGKFKINHNDYIGQELGITISNREEDGTIWSDVKSFVPAKVAKAKAPSGKKVFS